ncbi:hypothetical protein [Marinobacterium arenosum]|uniref:hypothetical protein n=1 Tax=Marinobacterium arenosum TaxID=2862496 RepID=UPI001C95B994|nr:hypothetical protein [Marinobacterium arenosum]MBY4678034.1 hypothetical protein [Marinobacterium arenosum]
MRMKPLKRWLQRRADNYQQNIRLLITGFVLFAVGGGLVVAGEFLLRPSLMQELLALLGLILLGGGLILALLGYLSLSLLRLFRFFNDESIDD